MEVKDDASDPARLFLENQSSELFEAAVIDSDYEHLTVLWMKEEGVGKGSVLPVRSVGRRHAF